MEALLALLLASYHQPNVQLAYPGDQPAVTVLFQPADTGWQVCPGLVHVKTESGKMGVDGQHFHSNDGHCHRDSDDSVVGPYLQRR